MADPRETLTPTPTTQDGEITLISHGQIKVDNKLQIYSKDISPNRHQVFNRET